MICLNAKSNKCLQEQTEFAICSSALRQQISALCLNLVEFDGTDVGAIKTSLGRRWPHKFEFRCGGRIDGSIGFPG